jgi:cytochrome c oxidase subunit II
MENFPFFPEQASTMAGQVDTIFAVVTLLSLVFAIPVAGLVIFFAIRYRRGARIQRFASAGEARHKRPTWLLETTWIAVPFVLAMGIFTWGARIYVDMYRFPDEGMDIYVVGRQWMWKFQHPTGQTEINTLHVPLGETVRLTMISQDVIHSFYVPAFRLKRDVLPGYYSTLWFEATKLGEFDLFCAEYCGTEHSRMIGRVIVMEPNQYAQWLTGRPAGSGSVTGAIAEEQVGSAGAGPATMAQGGQALFGRLGCSSCHQMDGSGAGPSLVGVYGSVVELANGQTLTADTQYIRDSILDPQAHVVAGYEPVMPSYAGQIDEEQLLLLVEYVRTLGQEGAAPADTDPGSGETDTPQLESSPVQETPEAGGARPLLGGPETEMSGAESGPSEGANP